MTATITIALSNHRPEIIPLAVAKMRQNEVIILEEPPEEAFDLMLRGKIGIDDYLMGIDTEYPAFGHRMCEALRMLHHEGYQILQVEPYLERLLNIHEHFSEGRRPADIEPDRSLWPVYLMEHRASTALLEFYNASANGHFGDLLTTVNAFAKADAQRFVMRDRLRARAIVAAIDCGQRIYVEAGQMHVGLAHSLRQRLPNHCTVVTDYLISAVTRVWPEPTPFFGPGDILTLIYRYNSGFHSPLVGLLIARALVQNKIITKEEIDSSTDAFPHTRDEAESCKMVQKLNLEQCRQLLPIISKMSTKQARQLVTEVLQFSESRPAAPS